MNRLVLGLLLAPFAMSSQAAVTLAPIFTDGAVFQRDQRIPVWGHARPGEKIEVRFGEDQATSTADARGRWEVRLAPRAASTEPRDLTVTGEIDGTKSEVKRRDILVGDVWLCAGQSNIEWPVRLSTDGAAAAAGAQFPTIRHVKVPRSTSAAPRDEMQLEWKSATPDAVPHFTAVGFYFARELQSRIQVPIGLINCTYGGTRIECWFEPGALRQVPAGAATWQDWEREWEVWRRAFDDYQKARTGDSAAAVKPWAPSEYRAPSGVFNGMLYTLIPYALKGVVWYQGESNVGRAAEYRELFPAMIQSWRGHWASPVMPFLFVQLPNYIDVNDRSGTVWAELRDAQMEALKLPGTTMVVAIDAGDPNDLHPTNKTIIGTRLATLAATSVYGLPGEGSSPRLKEALREAGRVKLVFAHAGRGLILRETAESGFQVAGADGQWVHAAAQVQGDTVMLHTPDVREPVAVRYAWNNAPTATLYSQGGLPAAPFSVKLP
jgi:sialate O-acetylesterase